MGAIKNLAGTLRSNLVDESKAYGYTLVIWGIGAILISKFGMPSTTHILAYIIGAVAGFASLLIVAYGGVLTSATPGKHKEMTVASMVHFIAALVTILVAEILIDVLPTMWAFFVAGVNASVTYNLMLLAELVFFREIREIVPYRR